MAATSATPFVNSSQQRPGIIIWANAIRTTTANDPGRQTLQDQIQANGFLFLDDYLENILAGPRREYVARMTYLKYVLNYNTAP